MSAAAMLELDGLSAGYAGAPVVRSLSLHVAPGEVVALMGANGAGKTTTLRAISGLAIVREGTIQVDGVDLEGMSPTARARLGIAHVPEDRGLFFGLTVAEHLRLGGAAEAVQRLAYERFPALEPLRERRAGLLSGGEQQMLAIARALTQQPKLLLLDEMSLGLAPVIVERLLPAVRRLADEEGTAVLLVEQHVHLALEIADRGYVLAHGDLVLSDRAEALRENRELLTASYLGERAVQR